MTDAVRQDLTRWYQAAVTAVAPEAVLAPHLQREGERLAVAGREVPETARLWVLAVGKASTAMARAVEAWAGSRVAAALVVSEHAAAAPPFAAVGGQVLEAAHPVPDARSAEAGARALEFAARVPERDVLLVLLSGGTSSLLATPPPGIAPEALAQTTRGLLRAGLDIEDLNTVRRHLSQVAGGRLACAAGAGRIEVLAMSDVPGDRLEVLGSGPCTGDPSRFADALRLAEGCDDGAVPASVLRYLRAGAAGEVADTPAPDDSRLANVRSTVVCGNRDARAAALAAAARAGCATASLAREIRGEARQVGRRLVGVARALAAPEPLCLVAGGETTVTVRGGGRGGRCQELALAAALALDGGAGIALLAAGTDGRDGPTDAAGAFADGGSVARGRTVGLEARAALADNDAHSFFAAEGGLLVTGRSGTNVCDLVLVHVAPDVSRSAKTV
ncbi:MAG: DUF4147 domain-containing protein [Proteobacteria bacterium]|nr:DUF4147 domain-containing protein [Pseudomonadota bacterium]